MVSNLLTFAHQKHMSGEYWIDWFDFEGETA
jgi:hypothetical protein